MIGVEVNADIAGETAQRLMRSAQVDIINS